MSGMGWGWGDGPFGTISLTNIAKNMFSKFREFKIVRTIPKYIVFNMFIYTENDTESRGNTQNINI